MSFLLALHDKKNCPEVEAQARILPRAAVRNVIDKFHSCFIFVTLVCDLGGVACSTPNLFEAWCYLPEDSGSSCQTTA